ncbi:hypothetical protein A2311_00595 [candidate division WOR-1 bacterium RIFOXYB2_FULL_48_7]|uniref:Single-stranded-DNA-specific exonuclease RecJ n=1 Tax=candidate division WOR-1 bacterium RIFOXYB2_FULL_48_7 TaxID=1802583 RepID=A0A1F4TT46_UNCSA|nr:MAG: hypothetical protein A2311_00595 [candidate division WOR-1 bacterium RIFOXYB2_FULL_48_7]
MSEDRLAAKTMAEELNRINVRRQNIGSSIKAEVLSRLTDEYLADHKLVLMSGQEWHPGVIGIVASQVAETYCRPTVLIGINEGMGRGSARSVPGFNIYELLNIGQEYFLDFGGHEGAAGFEILPENIEKLQHKLTNAINERLKAADLVPQLEIDAVLEPEIISLNLIKGLDQLAPFGEGNPPPVFLTQGLTLIDQRTVGKDGRHLKLWLEKAGNRLEAVGFGLGPSASKARVGSKYDIAYNLEANEWNGFESAQFSLIDFKEVG